MSSALEMSLDDLIKRNKKSGSRSGSAVSSGRGGRGGRASGLGPARRAFKRGGARAAPYTVAKAPDSSWQHDMFSDPAPAGRPSGIETGTKLFISNLDFGVSDEDIKELFAEVGELKRYVIHYDRSGRSKGTAEIVFARKVEALNAVKKYNNVQLDGKPMKIEIRGSQATAPGQRLITNGGFRNSNDATRSGQGKGGAFNRLRGRGGGRGSGRGRGGGRGKGRGENVSAEDLDAELEKYHTESMQTN